MDIEKACLFQGLLGVAAISAGFLLENNWLICLSAFTFYLGIIRAILSTRPS